ncbi:predicted protein [Chaetoceros tenuissimus]|uniref:Uncharacterized protein n=1 Tax=Chaetoceros tenuissimus TaxID=426638 RepID=A0AAD3CQY9_9STRA|nr:predicted protein [Chaetoceros tenuissimus]
MVLGSPSSPDDDDDDAPTSTPNNLSPTSEPNSSPNSSPTSGPAGNTPTSGPASGNTPTSGPASGNTPTSGPAGNSPSLPTSGPNSNPSGNSPTTGPSTSACTDSPLRMKIVINGRNRRRGCSWAARLNTQERCNIATVASHCPITCANYSGNCNVDSQARFKTQKPDGQNIMRSCDPWVKNNPNYRCTFPGVMKTCRSTC